MEENEFLICLENSGIISKGKEIPNINDIANKEKIEIFDIMYSKMYDSVYKESLIKAYLGL